MVKMNAKEINMPTRKHIKETAHIPKKAVVPTKEGSFPSKKQLVTTQTSQIEKPRINALSTVGKKRKPK